MSQEVNVHIGEIKVGFDGEILKTLLGSCVGIAILWREKKRCGLAHCLLPEIIPTSAAMTAGRFVEKAIPNILQMLEVPPSKYNELQALVVGGGNMTNPRVCNPTSLVGVANSQRAMEILAKLGIPVIHEDTGGEEGRRLMIASDTGDYKIEIIPRIIAV